MSIITKPKTFAASATIIASEHNDNFDTIYNDYNGNINNSNIAGAAAIANSKLNLASITQDVAHTGELKMTGDQFLMDKGADVASGTSIALGDDGNTFDITGTTTIQTITIKQAGTVVYLHFDSALTLTDNTGNLELNGADIVVEAEDDIILVSDGTNWRYVGGSNNARNFTIPSEAQGDILYRNATVWTRLAKGTATQKLAMNSGADAPEWVSGAGSSTASFSVYESGSQQIDAGNTTKVSFNTESFDTGSDFASDTFTAPVTGIYLFEFACTWDPANTATSGSVEFVIYKDDAEFSVLDKMAFDAFVTSGTLTGSSGSIIMSLSATDTIDIYGINSSNVQIDLAGTIDEIHFGGTLLA